jgi:hypothetical protein
MKFSTALCPPRPFRRTTALVPTYSHNFLISECVGSSRRRTALLDDLVPVGGVRAPARMADCAGHDGDVLQPGEPGHPTARMTVRSATRPRSSTPARPNTWSGLGVRPARAGATDDHRREGPPRGRPSAAATRAPTGEQGRSWRPPPRRVEPPTSGTLRVQARLNTYTRNVVQVPRAGVGGATQPAAQRINPPETLLSIA